MKLNWKNSLLSLTILGMEGSWLYMLIAILNGVSSGGQLSIIGLLAIYPISFVFNRLLRSLKLPLVPQRILNVVAWAAAMVLTIKLQLFSQSSFLDTTWLMAFPLAVTRILTTFQPAMLILLCSIVTWWLGRRVANLNITFTIAVGEFQFGLILLVLLFFSTTQLKLGMDRSLPISLTFLFFSLVGMSVSHAQEGAGWIRGTRRSHWTGLLIISICLVVLIGFIISLIVMPDFINLIISTAKWLLAMFNKLLLYLASLFPPAGPAEPLPIDDPMKQNPPPANPLKMFVIPEIVRKGIQYGWIILFGGMVLFALWRVTTYILSKLRRVKDIGEETETLRGAFKEDLLNLLRDIIAAIRKIPSLLHLRKKAIPIPPEIASIRGIYRKMLRWAAYNGYPRSPSQTPHEYLGMLVNLVPEAGGDLNLITQHYISARYGVFIPQENELNQMKQCWRNIKRYRLKRP
jgi:hypothetical protein